MVHVQKPKEKGSKLSKMVMSFTDTSGPVTDTIPKFSKKSAGHAKMVDMPEKDINSKDTNSGQIIATQDSHDVIGTDNIQYISEEVECEINKDLADG